MSGGDVRELEREQGDLRGGRRGLRGPAPLASVAAAVRFFPGVTNHPAQPEPPSRAQIYPWERHGPKQRDEFNSEPSGVLREFSSGSSVWTTGPEGGGAGSNWVDRICLD